LTSAELGLLRFIGADTIGLAVGHYDSLNGLLAGYEARNGRRVLMHAASNSKGNVNARMLYRDSKSGQLLPAMTLAVIGEGKEARVAIFAGGVDLLAALRSIEGDAGAKIAQRQALSIFMQSDIGQAALEAVPVLYAELEPADLGQQELARLKAPFGVIRMAMELTSGTYVGLPASEELFSSQRLSVMQEHCPGHLCQLRTRQFTLHANGLFDVLTDMDAALRCPGANEYLDGLELKPVLSSDGTCFGCCGPGCWGCTGIVNDECRGHDQCVCESGHLACIFGSAAGCGNIPCAGSDGATGHCNSLISAILGFLRDLFGFGGGGNNGGGDSGGGGVNLPPWPNMPCYSISSCDSCMGSPFCVPQFPFDPN
jgi:hypothetical protein